MTNWTVSKKRMFFCSFDITRLVIHRNIINKVIGSYLRLVYVFQMCFQNKSNWMARDAKLVITRNWLRFKKKKSIKIFIQIDRMHKMWTIHHYLLLMFIAFLGSYHLVGQCRFQALLRWIALHLRTFESIVGLPHFIVFSNRTRPIYFRI